MITVVIPTYNEEKNIGICLKALLNQTFPREKYELIIVDGESKDKTIEVAAELADKVIIQSSDGVGGARNDGVNISNGEIIATTDADCIPSSDWLEVINKNFTDPNVIAITGILIPYGWNNMNIIEISTYKLLFWFSNIILIILKIFGISHLCGANTAFRKEVFLEVGGYLPLDYADDIELFKRIRKKGKIILDRKMKIHYNVRRIKKMGLINYIFLIFKMEWNISIMNRRPMEGGYAKQTYDS
jgi:cellulose synthase/poly-beta-1,6-N-acetylglucosamine synthase-like glycosyltransferase